jgi:hypothetical protein
MEQNRNLQISIGGHKELTLLAAITGESMKDLADQLIHLKFVATFGNVDPSTVTIERRVVVDSGIIPAAPEGEG